MVNWKNLFACQLLSSLLFMLRHFLRSSSLIDVYDGLAAVLKKIAFSIFLNGGHFLKNDIYLCGAVFGVLLCVRLPTQYAVFIHPKLLSPSFYSSKLNKN